MKNRIKKQKRKRKRKQNKKKGRLRQEYAVQNVSRMDIVLVVAKIQILTALVIEIESKVLKALEKY